MVTMAAAVLSTRDYSPPPSGGITFVGATSAQTAPNGGGDLQITLPTIQADDVGVFYGRADESGSIPVLSVSGWTPEDNQNPTTGRDRVEYLWIQRLAGTETTIDMATTVDEERTFGCAIYRGVDDTTALDTAVIFDSDQNDSTPTPSPITTVTDNACVVLLHGHTHALITASGAPSGYTLVVDVDWFHRQMYIAHNLDVGTAGTVTPGDWTHTASAETGEYSTWSVALRPA